MINTSSNKYWWLWGHVYFMFPWNKQKCFLMSITIWHTIPTHNKQCWWCTTESTDKNLLMVCYLSQVWVEILQDRNYSKVKKLILLTQLSFLGMQLSFILWFLVYSPCLLSLDCCTHLKLAYVCLMLCIFSSDSWISRCLTSPQMSSLQVYTANISRTHMGTPSHCTVAQS